MAHPDNCDTTEPHLSRRKRLFAARTASSLLRGPSGKIYNRLVTNTSKPRRRWFQYSLRTLLVLMLLVCIGMSWFAVKTQQVRKERAAAEAIEGLGGVVSWVYPADSQSESRGRAWLRKLVGDDFFSHPDFVRIDNDAAMEYLTALRQLPKLELVGTQVTDGELAPNGYIGSWR